MGRHDVRLVTGDGFYVNTRELEDGSHVMASIPVSVSGEVHASALPNFTFREDIFTFPDVGETVGVANKPMRVFSLQASGVGASATAWEVILEGSLNGTNFSRILTHKTTTGNGEVMSSGVVFAPCFYFRSRVLFLDLGAATGLQVEILGQE